MKTNRRDAVQLARLLRAGELTAVWVPDEGHEAMRDLVRAREAAVDDLRRKRQVISSLLLKQGRVFPGKKTWGATYVRWLQQQTFAHPAQQVVLQEMVLAERHARERLARIEAAIAELLPSWSLAPVVEALQALRGIRLVTAATIMVEAGDLNRFESARQFMGYLGLVPGERSTGNAVRRLGITKAGNGRLRRALVESAWTYRHPPRTGTASATCSRTCPRPSRTSRGRRRPGCAPAMARWLAAADCSPSRSRLWHASWQALSRRSGAR